MDHPGSEEDSLDAAWAGPHARCEASNKSKTQASWVPQQQPGEGRWGKVGREIAAVYSLQTSPWCSGFRKL
jgi:hypothetical protein